MSPECAGCPFKEQLERLEQKYSESRQKIYARLESLERSEAVTQERYERILDEIKDINHQLKELSSKPQKRWDAAVLGVITTLIGGVTGYIVSKIFGGSV